MRADTNESHLLDLIGEIYDCALDTRRWPDVLQRVTSLVDGVQAAITWHDTTRPSFAIQKDWNVNRHYAEVMLENFAQNPFRTAPWYVDVDEPFSAFDHYGETELKRTPWFKRTHERFGYGDVALSVLARSVSQFGGLSVHRLAHQAQFREQELALLRVLTPHIRRSVMIADLLDARTLERASLSATLDLLAVGVVLTDETARIIHTNDIALRHLEEGRALRRDADRLSAHDPKVAGELRQAIADAADGQKISVLRSGIAIPVGDFAAWVLPLDSGLRRDFGSAFAARSIVFISEQQRSQPFPAELFVRRFGLTPSECRLLMLLTDGMTLSEAAAASGIALTTAKTHLARLFHKTGTQRQVDLVRLAVHAFSPARA